MDGFISMLQNQMVPITLIYIALIIGTHIVKRCLLKSIGNDDSIKTIKEFCLKAARIANICAIGIYVITIIVVIFFLSNPMVRTNIKTTTSATVDETFKPPTKDEISTSNKEVIQNKLLIKEQEAEADNKKAMESAADIFSEAAQKQDTKKQGEINYAD